MADPCLAGGLSAPRGSPTESSTSGSRSITPRGAFSIEVTDRPAATWVVQQLREAFPHDSAIRNLIFDRDAIFSDRVLTTVNALGLRPARTTFRSPWQNGIAERWVGSVRRELLDHAAVFNERHLRRLLREVRCLLPPGPHALRA